MVCIIFPLLSIIRSFSDFFVAVMMEKPGSGLANTVPLMAFTLRAKAPAELVTNCVDEPSRLMC